MKKILVSGCANCPYLKVWRNENGELSSGECNHPSYYVNTELPTVRMGVEFFVVQCISPDGRNVSTANPQKHPHWCPLPNEDVKDNF